MGGADCRINCSRIRHAVVREADGVDGCGCEGVYEWN